MIRLCLDCGGSGWVEDPFDDEEEIVCERCEGTGVDP